jgi:hypothetical protein
MPRSLSWASIASSRPAWRPRSMPSARPSARPSGLFEARPALDDRLDDRRAGGAACVEDLRQCGEGWSRERSVHVGDHRNLGGSEQDGAEVRFRLEVALNFCEYFGIRTEHDLNTDRCVVAARRSHVLEQSILLGRIRPQLRLDDRDHHRFVADSPDEQEVDLDLARAGPLLDPLGQCALCRSTAGFAVGSGVGRLRRHTPSGGAGPGSRGSTGPPKGGLSRSGMLANEREHG